jgi:hypothetical protein
MIQIAGGIILAVLFFAFLPLLIYLGLYAIAGVAAIAAAAGIIWVIYAGLTTPTGQALLVLGAIGAVGFGCAHYIAKKTFLTVSEAAAGLGFGSLAILCLVIAGERITAPELNGDSSNWIVSFVILAISLVPVLALWLSIRARLKKNSQDFRANIDSISPLGVAQRWAEGKKYREVEVDGAGFYTFEPESSDLPSSPNTTSAESSEISHELAASQVQRLDTALNVDSEIKASRILISLGAAAIALSVVVMFLMPWYAFIGREWLGFGSLFSRWAGLLASLFPLFFIAAYIALYRVAGIRELFQPSSRENVTPDVTSTYDYYSASRRWRIVRNGVLIVVVVVVSALVLDGIKKHRLATAKAQMELQAAQNAARELVRLAREAAEAKARAEREAKEANERALEKSRLAQLARWKFVGSTEFANIYANPTSRRRSGDVINMWTVFDIKTPVELDVGWFASSLVMNEFDCRYGAQRTVFSSIYSGHMASGEAVTSDKDITAWTMPQSGTIEGDLWKIACDRQ